MNVPKPAPICPYCGASSRKVTGAELYPSRPDLHGKVAYECAPCDARVGCHPGTETPLGNLADRPTRAARIAAHSAIDPLWRYGGMGRNEVYKWLAGAMGMSRADCHISMMTVEQCQRAVAAVEALAAERPRKKSRP